MENLRILNYNTALDLLKQSEQLLQTASMPKDITDNEKSKLLALTYNNLGKMQANVALNYLKKALDLEIQSQQDSMNIAGTMLNICAILSQLKKHKKAIFYAQSCLQKAEHVLQKLKQMPYQAQADSGSDISEQLQRDSYLKNVYTTITIALYNLGVEHEYMNEYSHALESFNRAQYLTQEILDRDPQMTKVINEGLQSVMMKQQKKFIISNIYGGRNTSNSPGRLMIDMNSSRFAPIDGKNSTNQIDQQSKFMSKRETLGNISISSGTSRLNNSLRDQANFAYGNISPVKKQNNNQQNMPIIKQIAMNHTKLVFHQQERKAISNLRNQSKVNQSPLKQTYYGMEERNSIRRGSTNQANNIINKQQRNTNLLNKINQEFSLPTIQNNKKNMNNSYYGNQNPMQESDSSVTSNYEQIGSTNQLQPSNHITSQNSIRQQAIAFNKTSTQRLIISKSSSKKQSTMHQPNKISPLRSFQVTSIGQTKTINNFIIPKKYESQEFHPQKTSVSFGAQDGESRDNSKPSSVQYQRNSKTNQQSFSTINQKRESGIHQPEEAKMQQAINNINVRLGDLQAKLLNYKTQHDMILEQDNEGSYRNGSTLRSNVAPIKQSQSQIYDNDIHELDKIQDIDQQTVNFDQLSYVSSEAYL